MIPEIKIGDKVRLKEFPGMNPYYKGRICEVASIDNNGYVTFKEGGIHPKDYELELVEPCDRKTEFLQKLGALLKEYDAEIYPNGCVVDGIGFKVGDGDIYYNMNYGFGDFINADNIMDFEKD